MLKISDNQQGIISILSEFTEGFDALAAIPPSVAIIGSARATSGDSAYMAAVETARLLARAGFGIITGGWPGIMVAGYKGSRDGGATSSVCIIDLRSADAANSYLEV